jgi:serine/threonine protein kinase
VVIKAIENSGGLRGLAYLLGSEKGLDDYIQRTLTFSLGSVILPSCNHCLLLVQPAQVRRHWRVHRAPLEKCPLDKSKQSLKSTPTRPRTDMALLQDGQAIGGTYEVEKFIGEGAFAEVYRVRHRFLGRQAMKVFKRVGMTQKEIEEMLGEAILLSRISHPNIVHVFNADITETDKGTCGFFTMEYVAGGTLDRYWRSFAGRFIPTEQAVDLTKQICQGLMVAHSETPPIIHRDIKPQNVLVGYDGTGIRVRISDFGLAKRVNPMTLLASAQGTPAFKAPEFLEKKDSTATDMWAVGTTLYLLLTDQLPFPELNEAEFFNGKRWKRPIIPPSRLNIDVDSALDSIILKSLALDPQNRYPNAGAMLEDLSTWRKKEPTADKTLPTTSTNSKTALGHRTAPDLPKAEKMIEKAFELAAEAGKLIEAADILEEAINAAPTLRKRYASQVQMWRKGIIIKAY